MIKGSLGILFLPLILAPLMPAAIADEYWDQKQQEYRDNLKKFDEDMEFRHRLEQSNRVPARTTFAAIAYCKSTDKWGYSCGKDSEQLAEQVATSNCGAANPDVLIWSKDSYYCALAVGAPGCYGGGTGASLRLAEAAALQKAAERGRGGKIVLWVRGNSTRGVEVSEWKPDGTASIDSPNQINLFTVAPHPRR
jgi:hypothetical protein